MSSARNDIDRAIRDGIESRDQDRPDLSYRVRLLIAHLIEGLDALGFYSHDRAVRALCGRVPAEHRKALSAARGTPQRVGKAVLEHARNRTFHYPSPDPKCTPTGDAELRDVLNGMSDQRALLYTDHGKRQVTLGFADSAVLAVALAKHAVADADELQRQFETTRDGAIAFVHWVDALVLTYFRAFDIDVGEPEWLDDPDHDES